MSDPLFPYQTFGAEWLASRSRALLADEMGLGKTVQAIRAADIVAAKNILVLCPAAARINWAREFQKFSKTFRTTIVVQSRSQRVFGDTTICSYDLAETVPPIMWDVLILDEAHYLKTPDAKRTQAVFGKSGLVRRARRVWCLSGTPMPNHAGELWPMLYTFGATPRGYDAFVEKYCTYFQTQYRKQITGTKQSTIPELKGMLNAVMLRRRKDEVMKELPPISYGTLVVEETQVNLDEADSFVQYIFPIDRTKELEERLERERQLVNAIITGDAYPRDQMKALEAMANSVSTLRRYVGLQKMPALADILKEELNAGAYEKLVIFAVHRDVIEGLRVRLVKFKPVTLYGGTAPDKRQRNIDKFQKDPKTRVFIGNIQAAGTAITLTSAHNVVFAEQDWVPGNNAQAAMRCHRIGQTKPVFVRVASLANSLDERVSEILRKKTRDITKLFDDKSLPETKQVDIPENPANEFHGGTPTKNPQPEGGG